MLFARILTFLLALAALAGAVGSFVRGGVGWVVLGVFLVLLCLLLVLVARVMGDPAGTVERLSARRAQLEGRTGATPPGAPLGASAPDGGPAPAPEPANRAERRAAERAARRRGNDAGR